MISFKLFVSAIHDAIMGANDALMDKNVSILDKYFTETTEPASSDVGTEVPTSNQNKILVPKTVVLQYPNLTSSGEVEMTDVHVPLITLVPLSMTKVEKTTLTADFDIEIVDGDLQLNFINRSAMSSGIFKKSKSTTRGTLEIVLSPQESTEGLKLLVDGYEAIIKRQIS